MGGWASHSFAERVRTSHMLCLLSNSSLVTRGRLLAGVGDHDKLCSDELHTELFIYIFVHRLLGQARERQFTL